MAKRESSQWTRDDGLAEWIDRLSRLYTSVVADVLDRPGYRNQCPCAFVRPLAEGLSLALTRIGEGAASAAGAG